MLLNLDLNQILMIVTAILTVAAAYWQLFNRLSKAETEITRISKILEKSEEQNEELIKIINDLKIQIAIFNQKLLFKNKD